MNRQENLRRLEQKAPYDLIIIGGGATGCGTALDAASRGLKVALVEQNDFAEGTSSRSTKLVHGGVRYLEKAVRKLDRTQFDLVREGLHERALLLHNARHLARRLELITPLYSWHEIPYIFSGLKLYDLLAGSRRLGHSRLLSRSETLRRLPGINARGLKAGVLYYDGQFHDARLALALALSAESLGAAICNHLKVTGFLNQDGQISGVIAKDRFTAQALKLKARGVINATGPFCDQLRGLDDPQAKPLLTTSSGIHIVLDKAHFPASAGLMIPQTDDGRVLFALPWENQVLIGTTDEPAQLSEHPCPLEKEIDYLLHHLANYLAKPLTRQDIKAAWSGLRPLVSDPDAADTAELVREHLIQTSASGLVTICGGKWTTYRKMAEDCLDHALRTFPLAADHRECRTKNLAILGAFDYSDDLTRQLENDFAVAGDIADYLCRNYGDQAPKILQCSDQDARQRLHPEHPVLNAEILYSIHCEHAQRAIDVLARRTPLALIDQRAAVQSSEKVISIMAKELNWSEQRCTEERQICISRLRKAL